ncbi:uncharacterized protein LOC117644073 [Thrips palmi]|uniref:Uncharacterized protein LOC117644073 n=1 Tax=Thrips palmi TaxID=161013 RepID=A0A6P8ZLN2_THRPL|nr:uncharacterized protein LOC117644073 [Thrips palmi]
MNWWNVLFISASVRASDVAYLAMDFFAVRGVDAVVLAVSDAAEKLSVFRILAGDGRFQVSIPENSASAHTLLNVRHQTNIGVLLKGGQHRQRWLQKASIVINCSLGQELLEIFTTDVGRRDGPENELKSGPALAKLRSSKRLSTWRGTRSNYGDMKSAILIVCFDVVSSAEGLVKPRALADGRWFNDSFHWLSIEDDEKSSVDEWPLRFDSEVFRARRTTSGNGSTWVLDEMLRSNAEPVASWPFAAWTELDGLVSTDIIHFGGDPLEDHRSQLRRAKHYWHPVVRTAVFEEHYADRATMQKIFDLPPEIVLAHLNFLSIVTLAITQNTFELFNATVIAKDFVKSGELEVPPSGVFSGASGAVQRGSVDLVSTGLIMSLDRLHHFAFSATTFELRIVGLFLAEGTLGSVDALITPFHWFTWVSLIALALAGLLLYRRFRQAEGQEISWSESLIGSVGSLTGQGFGSPGDWFSGRVLLLVFEILFMLIQGYYGSAIVKFLLRPPPPSVRNVEELLHSHYPVALHEWWLIIREFETAASGIERQLYEKKVGPPHGLGYMSSEALEKVLMKPLHVIAGAEETVYKSTLNLNEGQACRLHEMDVLSSKHIAPIIHRHCPFKETIYAGNLLQRERGILQRASRKWAQPRAQCSGGGAHGEGEPIGLDPVKPVVGVIVFGIIVAPVIACIEVVTGRRK